MFSKKRGESLVEVIVALGILAFVFMGVVNVIASSITLNMSSRQRTEAIAMVQKNLSEYLAKNASSDVCTITAKTAANPVSGTVVGSTGCNTNTLTDSTQTCYWVELADLAVGGTNGESYSLYGLNNDNFIKVISHGKWYTRILGEQSFEIDRVIKKN